MQFRVSRNDQEYGPYKLEELQQYVSEGRILPTDYVFNGMEWMQISQFLQDPQKALMASQSISSITNAAPQNNFSNTQANTYASKSKSKLNLKSIAGVMFVIALVGYGFNQYNNSEKALKFHNGFVELLRDTGSKLESMTAEEESLKEISSLIKKSYQKVEEISFHAGKKEVGYEVKDTAIQLLKVFDKEAKKRRMLLVEIKKDMLRVEKIEDQKTKIEEANAVINNIYTTKDKFDDEFVDELESTSKKLQDLLTQYAENNGLEKID